MSKQELASAIPNTSLKSLQRAFAELRENYNAQLTCFGKLHRFRLDFPLPLPLHAPEPEDLVGFTYLLGLAEPILSSESYERVKAAIEHLDGLARLHHASADLPPPNVITASYSHASRVDPRLFGRLILACRRKTLRITYESPWQDTPGVHTHDIEPWAIHVSDAQHYVRAWSIDRKHPRTFNCAFIQTLEEVDVAPPRQPIPARPWELDGTAFGIDSDRPGIAVLHFEGGVARWVASMQWHPEQDDEWIEPRQLLKRTIPYHSCRELARHLAQYSDGIVAIESAELREELLALVGRTRRLSA